MTILLTGSRTGNTDIYKKIIEELESMGHTIKLRGILDADESSGAFKRDLELCDFMICEASSATLSLGLEIATALAKNKHVLVLCSNAKSLDDLSTFIRENSSRYAHVSKYTKETLGKVLLDSIKKIKKQLHYVLYVELPSKYGDLILDLQKTTRKSKKQIIEEALVDYLKEEPGDEK
jgi:hypothetical protein